MKFISEEDFEKQFYSQYKQTEFLNTRILSFLDKNFDAVDFEVIDCTPKLVHSRQPSSELEIISIELLVPFLE